MVCIGRGLTDPLVPTQVLDLVPDLVELNEVCLGPPLKPVKVPLDSIPSLQWKELCTTELGVLLRVQFISLSTLLTKMLNSASPSGNLWNVTRHCSPLGPRALDHNSLSVTNQPISYPLTVASIKSTSIQFRNKLVS